MKAACVSWWVDDVKTVCPEWSDMRCVEFLRDNEDAIQCAMIERGWDVIRSLTQCDQLLERGWHTNTNPKGDSNEP